MEELINDELWVHRPLVEIRAIVLRPVYRHSGTVGLCCEGVDDEKVTRANEATPTVHVA